MRFKLIISALAATLALGVSNHANAQASSLDDLLRLVEEGRARDSAEARERIREFEAQRGEQERLLQEARQRQSREESRSENLESTYGDNEETILGLRQDLREALGDLQELFGVVTLVSGDAASQFETSLTSIQYPERRDFLLRMGDRVGEDSRIATVRDIERLWYELQREATELGRVVRMPLEVIAADGERETRNVVRVGAFNLVADGKYLEWDSGTGNISELVRQPSESRYINSTSRLVNSDSGFTPFALDPTRGQILSLLIEQPTIVERIQQGAEIGYLIIALGILALLLAIERLITLSIISSKVTRQLKNPGEPDSGNPLGRVLKVYHDNKGVDTDTLELKLGEAIIRETPKLQRFLLFLKIISVVAPLMGLLGTVTGMIQTFQAITLFGTGDPTLMAGGISQALVTTVLGLAVAIPTVLLHTVVAGRSKRVTQVLQEQSAGLIADHSEAQNNRAKGGGAA